MFNFYDGSFCFVKGVSLHWIETYCKNYGVSYTRNGFDVTLVRENN